MLKVCDNCGVALTPGLGGAPQRLMVTWESGAATCVDLCRGCYTAAVPVILESVLGSGKARKRVA